MRGKQSGIRYGQKKQNGQSDLRILIDLARYVRKKYKVMVKREPYLIFYNEKLVKILDDVKEIELEHGITIKNPDLLWMDKYGTWIMEVDGKVHTRYSEKTRKRNELFINNHINLIVVDLEELKQTGTNIYEYIDNKILEKIKNG